MRRLTRITTYILLLFVSALVSFFSGGRRDIAEHSTQTGAGLIPSTPIAHADVPGCSCSSGDSNPPGEGGACGAGCGASSDTAGGTGGGCGGCSGGCGSDD